MNPGGGYTLVRIRHPLLVDSHDIFRSTGEYLREVIILSILALRTDVKQLIR